ncbi:alpha-hydroxy-acid oxidizing enzyme [Alsobacter metallidurans]|uniref:Alpha-hydroxy-acid oxidizing enzyme n=1 Tax=Alsobacter metallidurans TaxID=340221 RepID=A0A917I5G2_9HYPH|nr:alpha-hydroxy acid oxidase [Alsobacter metallidurans]GGH16647.1 alpha-hydroxy-acid oxidizing enzyme [Alsobacter metallidurans]
MTGLRPPPLDRIPSTLSCLADYESLARERLDDGAWAHVAGAAADGLTAQRNREAFDRLTVRPRILRDVAGGATAVTLLGRRLAHPVLLAPIAYQRLFHPDGERATAMAAEAVDAVMVVSTLASETLEAIAQAGGAGQRWFQLYWQGDRAATLALCERAQAAGCEALVLTVDSPVTAFRNDLRRAGFRLPDGVSAANLPDGRMPPPGGAGRHPVFDGAMAAAPRWADVAWLCGAQPLPVLVKGVLHPDDAAEAVALGCAGVVVSNHGGRTLDGTPASIEALPAVAAGVAGRGAVLLDGGVRRGTDILKARALGADAVLIGRPATMALAAAGALGVAHAVKLLVEELAVAMALCGLASLDDAGPELLG